MLVFLVIWMVVVFPVYTYFKIEALFFQKRMNEKVFHNLFEGWGPNNPISTQQDLNIIITFSYLILAALGVMIGLILIFRKKTSTLKIAKVYFAVLGIVFSVTLYLAPLLLMGSGYFMSFSISEVGFLLSIAYPLIGFLIVRRKSLEEDFSV